MKKKRDLKPTNSELEILQILWNKGPLSVRNVNDILNEKKKTGYTTTLKIMQIMHEKKLLDRDEKKRIHIYSPLVNKDEIQKQLLESFLESTFSGSTHKMVLLALGNHRPSQSELEQIKKLIADIEESENYGKS